MVSVDKLIKVGVKYTDNYFEQLKKLYTNAYNKNNTLEEFLNDTRDYSISNPLEANGFKEALTDDILNEVT